MYRNLLMACMFFSIIAACKKAETDSPVLFGKIEIINKTISGPDSIITKINGKDLLPGFARTGGANLQLLPEKEYQLQFYAASKPDSLLQEANVKIEGNTTKTITLFSVDQTDPVKIITPPADVAEPGPNEVKISIANFTTGLPENLDIEVMQQITSRRPFRYVTAGIIENVGKTILDNSFSPYLTLPVAINTTTGEPTYDYMLVLKNRDTGEIILIDAPLGSAGIVSGSAENRLIRAYLIGDNQGVYPGQL